MTRYVVDRVIAGAAAISLFCAGFYLVSLGLKDAAFRGRDRRRPGWARPARLRTPSVM